MALTRSFPTQVPTGQPITDTRRTTAGLVARNADGTPRAGVFPAGTAPIVTGRASMGYDIAPFLAATSRVNTGVELIANDAVTLLAPAGYAAPPSNSRIDVIWVRSQFTQHADTNNDVVFGVAQGVAAPIPAKPAIPPGALELATATLLATTTTTATAVITQTFPYTAAAGGVVWLRNQPEQDAWSPSNGATAFRLDTGEYIDRIGGVWLPNDAGSMVIRPASIVGGTQNADGSISFTAAASVSLNGVFTSRFREYEVRYQTSAKTLNAGIEIRLRAAGTDNTSASYFYRRVGSAGAGIVEYGTGGGVSFEPDFNGYPVIIKSLRLMTPHLPVNTQVWSAGGLEANNTTGLLNMISFAGTHKVASAFDGITLRVAAQDMTGSVVVIGHR